MCIEVHVAKSRIALIPLQQLRGIDIERYYAEDLSASSSPRTVSIHHACLHVALAKAVRDRLLTVNPALNLGRRRTSNDPSQGARASCWSAVEARRVIEAAKSAGGQMAAFVFLALDSGARKSELHGLTWADVDLDAGTVTIARQLDEAGVALVYGPTKTDRARSISLSTETVATRQDLPRRPSPT